MLILAVIVVCRFSSLSCVNQEPVRKRLALHFESGILIVRRAISLMFLRSEICWPRLVVMQERIRLSVWCLHTDHTCSDHGSLRKYAKTRSSIHIARVLSFQDTLVYCIYSLHLS